MKYKVLLLLVPLIILICGLSYKNKELQMEVSIAANNQKILLGRVDSLHTENRVLQLTSEQLDYFNDSIIREMDKVRKELKIKDNRIKSLSYVQSVSSRTDTITFRDTVFIDGVKLDTIIKDEWYSIKVGLEYPNRIVTTPSFISDKYIIVSKKKETINPPKKFFVCRWFQRKHWVMEVNIVEKNPYIKESNNKFIEIMK